MLRQDVITLVGEETAHHGIYDQTYKTEREVFVIVEGVGMNEMYLAMAQGLRPEVKFHLALAEDYEKERTCVWQGETYSVIRTALDRDGGDGITLVCQRGVQTDA